MPLLYFFKFSNRKIKGLIFVLLCILQFASLSTSAQYSKLIDFGSKGSYPDGSLISDGTFFYGMTSSGGTNDFGTIFKIKLNGQGFTKVLDFNGAGTGSFPYGSLFSDGTFLYGMTSSGGLNNFGTLFKIKPDGTGYLKLLDFDGTINGSAPYGSLISDGSFLYGMTSNGGANDTGTIFKVNPDGTNFTKLLDFNASGTGSYPNGSLLLDGGFLYGMTNSGGADDFGTVFKIMPDGSGFLKLSDLGVSLGTNPAGSLITDGTFLYGMTSNGSTNGFGAIFKIKTDGTGAARVLSFDGTTNGSNPNGDLLSDGTFLYGLTSSGGVNDFGTMFKIKPDGTSYVKLLDFDATPNGSYPYGSLISDGTLLYGLTDSGGTDDFGTIFKIKPDGTGFVKLLDFGVTGGNPYGSLISDGTFLYGVTKTGGSDNLGTVFKVLPNGTEYNTLHSFRGFTYSDGSFPLGSLYFDGTFLYGMTSAAGTSNAGTIFKIKPDGTGYSLLFNFDGNNGDTPYGSLTSLDGTFLYGMTSTGGSDSGIIFKIKSDGTGYVILSDFNTPGAGGDPRGDLLLDGTFLYGMTRSGGSGGLGTIFKLKDDGTGYTNLFDFDGTNGGNPFGSLISDGTFLYGMTSDQGVAGGQGAIFKIKPDGTGFTKLLDFKTVTDASWPYGSLTYDGTFLYGMTSNDESNSGSIFKINTDGTGYSQLFFFNAAQKGKIPRGSLVQVGTTLYGMTSQGGTDGLGTLFMFETLPQCPPGPRLGGTLDVSYNALVDAAVDFSAIEIQSNGKSIACVPTDATINGVPNNKGLLRFNTDGSLDGTFASADFDPLRHQLILQPDDKILVVKNAGTFTFLKRLMSDGTVDASFAGPNIDNSGFYKTFFGPLALQADGKVLYAISNTFNYQDDLIRLNTSGTVDGTFNAPTDLDANVIKVQPDGKILVGGAVSGNGIIRLNSSGSIDPSFAVGTGTNYDPVNDLVTQSDGKIIIVGLFTKYNGVSRNGIARLNTDGSLDASFNPSGISGIGVTGVIPHKVSVMSNGQILIAGSFITVNGNTRKNLVRLNADGSLDCTFNPGGSANSNINDFAIQADGRILAVGDFTQYDGTARNALVRVNNGVAPTSCVPATERAALIALYNSTNGASWSFKDNWLSADESTWFGVGVTGCRVTTISMQNNNLSGPLPAELGNLTELKQLILVRHPNLTGAIPTELGNLAKLQQLSLWNNNLTGSIPPSMGNLSSLNIMELMFNQLNGSVPSSLGNLPTIDTLRLDNNQLTGTIPTSLFNLSTLNQMALDNNQLTGNISPLVGNLTGLKWLGLSGNQLTGSIPSEIGNMISLQGLILGRNQLTGSLPTSIGNLVNLKGFNVFTNQLTGTLPSSMANLVNLTGLGLSVNQFTGAVPAGIGLIPNLNDVSLRDNDFTSIPTFVSTSFSDLLVYGNKLNFGHLEPNISKGGFVYAPQDNLPGGVASACAGSTLTINFSTPGTANSYQWYKDGVLIMGATSSNFVKSNATAADAGNYTVQVSNSIVTGLILQSDNFVVTINSLPTSPSANPVSVCPGSIATLTATGGTTGQYRWYTVASGGTAIAGQTNNTFVTPGISVVTTFYVSLNNGSCESARTAVVVTPIASACAPPTIASASISITIGNNKTLDLKTLITTSSGTTDINSITVTVPPPSGAIATITAGVLTLDYRGISFAGKEKITIQACDTNGNCSTQQIEIEVIGDIEVYNGISPNGDELNDIFLIQYIDVLPDTQNNKVTIYNRWGSKVFEVSNYNNTTNVFRGLNDNGNELPSGTYFYKIEFASGRKSETGYLSLKR